MKHPSFLYCTQSGKQEGNYFSLKNTFVLWILSYISKFKSIHQVSFLQCKSDFLSSSLVLFLSRTYCFLGCSTATLISESCIPGKLLTLMFGQRNDIYLLLRFVYILILSNFWIFAWIQSQMSSFGFCGLFWLVGFFGWFSSFIDVSSYTSCNGYISILFSTTVKELQSIIKSIWLHWRQVPCIQIPFNGEKNRRTSAATNHKQNIPSASYHERHGLHTRFLL